MPRAFDSDDLRHGAPRALTFIENVECEKCGTLLDGVFHDQSTHVEDIVEPPSGNHTCPACGHHWSSTMTGWTFYTEAG